VQCPFYRFFSSTKVRVRRAKQGYRHLAHGLVIKVKGGLKLFGIGQDLAFHQVQALLQFSTLWPDLMQTVKGLVQLARFCLNEGDSQLGIDFIAPLSDATI